MISFCVFYSQDKLQRQNKLDFFLVCVRKQFNMTRREFSLQKSCFLSPVHGFSFSVSGLPSLCRDTLSILTKNFFFKSSMLDKTLTFYMCSYDMLNHFWKRKPLQKQKFCPFVCISAKPQTRFYKNVDFGNQKKSFYTYSLTLTFQHILKREKKSSLCFA